MTTVRGLASAGFRAVFGLAVLSGIAAGAAPSISRAASPATAGSLGSIQAWLDTDSIRPDAAPGGTVEIGVSFWDLSVQNLASINRVFVRLHPAKGSAAPSEGRVTADFPGHVTAALVVPKGGPGSITVGVHGQACDENGTCRPADIALAIVGTGPPPDAKNFDLVEGSFHDIVGDVVVGQPTSLTVEVMPRGLWDVSAVGLSDRVFVVARDPTDGSGAELGLATLERQGGAGAPYSGTIVIRQTGTVDLSVMIPAGGAHIDIAGERKEVTVIDTGGRPSDPPAAASPARGALAEAPASTPARDQGVPAIVWILAAVVVLVGGGFLVLRFLADQ